MSYVPLELKQVACMNTAGAKTGGLYCAPPIPRQSARNMRTPCGLHADWQVANMAQILTQWVLRVRVESVQNPS